MSVLPEPDPSQSHWLRRRWLALVAAALLALLGFGCRRWSRPHDAPPKPFTRESVIAELSDRYPQASLPADTLPPNALAEENIVFDASVEPSLALDVYRPRGAGVHPAVLVVHGGGWERGARTMERPFAKRLAALGFVTVPVSYRLGSRGRFPNALFDLKTAVHVGDSNG